MRYLTKYKENFRIPKLNQFKDISKGSELQFVDIYSIKKTTSPAFSQKTLPDHLRISNFTNVLISTNTYLNYIRSLAKNIKDSYDYFKTQQFEAKFAYYAAYINDKTIAKDFNTFKNFIDSFYNDDTILKVDDYFKDINGNIKIFNDYNHDKNINVGKNSSGFYNKKTNEKIDNLEEYYESYNKKLLNKLGIDNNFSFKMNGILYIPIKIKSNSKSLKLINNEMSVVDIDTYTVGFEIETVSKLIGLTQGLRIYKNIQDMFNLIKDIKKFNDMDDLYNTFKSSRKVISSNLFVECLGNNGSVFYLPIDHCSLKIDSKTLASNLNDLKTSLLGLIK